MALGERGQPVAASQGEQDPRLRQLDFPAGEDHLWMPPILADPTDPAEIYQGGPFAKVALGESGKALMNIPDDKKTN